ncbi:MAG TPA: aminotransferase class V-fold PLP-dependent enzyme [Gaiellaceae bacterium]|nr:aminotransferase class V-fold PLP-dependent enzyme [Gaiellaceae bacterium]
MTGTTRLRDEFLLDRDVVFLNHGSFGACPREVFARYQEWQVELERRPVEFLGRRLRGLLADARGALGAYVNADPDDLVFVQNATAGVNLAAWAVALEPGDEVLSTSREYGALDLAWEHICAHARARYVRTPVTVPLDDAVEEIWSGVTDRTRVLFVSHITSETAVLLPVQELCLRARERGIKTVVDGAHVPGHVPLDLRALGVDYYAGNCHKWLCAPKGAGFLYVRRELQATIAPLVIGWGYGEGATFLSRHEEQGTRDPAAFLTVPAAIEWQRDHDWDAVRERCRGLAARTPARLGLEPLGNGLQMVAMRLPPHAPSDLQQRLYDDYRIEVPVSNGIIRASYQGYNDEADLTALADALAALVPVDR